MRPLDVLRGLSDEERAVIWKAKARQYADSFWWWVITTAGVWYFFGSWWSVIPGWMAVWRAISSVTCVVYAVRAARGIND